ncbi:MAG: hypothetical protein ACTSWA_10790, partial [Candidatus Thorarchaeota archaeon]
MLDPYEAAFGLDLLLDDTLDDLDGDTLSNIYEMNFGTFPNSTDTDADAMPDDWEIYYRLDPLFDDSGDDLDLDGSTNLEEYLAGTNPNDHGFYWGVQVNHTITCDLLAESTISGTTERVREQVIIGIVETPEAPVDVLYIPTASYLAVWARNQTPFSLSGFFTMESVLLAPAYPAIMKGNWTLLTEFVEELNENPDIAYVVNETETTWGFSYSMVVGDLNVMSSGVWFKSDGTLRHVIVDIEVTALHSIHVQLTRATLDSPETQNFIIIIAIGGGAVVVVIGLILYSKRRAP